MKKINIEDGIVVGTAGGKYELKNPIVQYLLKGFDDAIADLANSRVSPSSILEIGCGEGHVTQILLDHTSANIFATDLSASVLSRAKSLIVSDRVSHKVADVEKLEPLVSAPELVVCCEVLEHLRNPHIVL